MNLKEKMKRLRSLWILTLLVTLSAGSFDGFTMTASAASSTWTSRTSNATTSIGASQLQRAVFGNGKWLGLEPVNTEIVSSVNGNNWIKGDITFIPYDAVYAANKWIVVGPKSGDDNNTIMTSPDGAPGTWNLQTPVVSEDLYSVASNGSRIVAVGAAGRVLYSDDGVAWTATNAGTTEFNKITYGGGKFVAVGMSGVIYTSSDGISWTPQTSGTSVALWSIGFGMNLYIAVGSDGTLLTSGDGITWTPRSIPIDPTYYLTGVAYNSSKFVVVGDAGTVISSVDGMNWTAETPITTNNLNDVAYGQNKFVAVGVSGWLQTQSSAADLSNLSLSQGTLSPGFASSITSYTVDVGSSVSSIDVTPTVADTTGMATVKVNGSAVTSGSAVNVPLAIGSNTITVLVTPQEGTQMTYTVNVIRPSSNANLSNLTLNQGTLTPGFAAGTTSYDASVANGVTSIQVTPTVTDSTASVKVNGSTTTSGSAAMVALYVGANPISITVTAQDGTTQKTYTVTVIRAASSNVNLSSLTVSQGTLSPTFASGTTSYAVEVPYTVSSIDVTPIVADGTAAMTVNGTAAASGTVRTVSGLAVGANTITVVVTAQDGTTETYTVTVTREAASSNVNLSSLTVSQGTLSPTFASGTTSYAVEVPYTVSSIDVTPIVADGTATITVNGNPTNSGRATDISGLVIGSNSITIVVKAQDNTQKTYTVTVTRAALSSNALLSGLSLSDGALNPVFDPNTNAYTTTVTNSVYSITVTPTVADNSSIVKVNDVPVINGQPSNGIALNVGSNNTINVDVTAQNGTSNRYTLTVTRAPIGLSGNADLSGLTLSSGSLIFNPVTVSYDVYVGRNVGGLTLTPVTVSDTATVTMSVYYSNIKVIDGVTLISGQPSRLIPLIGITQIHVDVTAQNGVKKTYIVNVIRAISSGGGGGGWPSSPPSTSPSPSPVTGIVHLDGNSIEARVTKEMTNEGIPFTKVTVDADILAHAFTAATSPVVTIEINNIDPVVKLDLPASALLDAASKQPNTFVEIKVDGTTYHLPLSLLNNVPRDAVVSITITKISGTRNDDTNAAARRLGLKPLLNNPFDYNFSFNDKEVTDFNGVYVTRTLTLPSAADSNHVTAVWVDANNNIHFVPSVITNKNGLTEVEIHSPHNSMYTVIQSNKSFTDMNTHWAKADVELLANKLIIDGVNDTEFAPDHFITRAEFAALLVRSLGLTEATTENSFMDVKTTDWFAGAVGTAEKYGLISGYEDGTFRPNANITREQMVVMIEKALKVGGKSVEADTKAIDKFTDHSSIADWAKDATAQTIKTGIMQGMTDTTFGPKENATRAQGTVMLKRMLQHLEFIN